LLTAE